MTQRITKTVSRSCGFQIELDDKGVAFLEDEGRLFSVCEESVYEFITADQIDPDSSFPDTRHSYRKVFTIGANSLAYKNHYKESEAWLESALLFYIIKNTNIVKREISHSFLTLLSAEEIYHSLKKRINLATQEYDKVFEIKSDSFVLPQLPMIDYLNQEVSSFFSYCKEFCDDCTGFIKTLFQELEIKGKKVTVLKVKNSGLLEQSKRSILDINELLTVICNIRNALPINHLGEGQKVQIFDFSNTKGNKIMPPSISFDLSNYKENPFKSGVRYDLVHLMSDVIDNLSVVFPMILKTRFDEYYAKNPQVIPKWYSSSE